MLDLSGFVEYLRVIGFAENGQNTYKSYLRSNILEIFNNINEYEYLSDEERIVKFSNENTNFKEKFDKYHNFGNNTFNDTRSGARRYKYYLQYKSIKETMKEYETNKSSFNLNGSYIYFKVFNIEYPIKAICRKNIDILELRDKFTTSEAQSRLKNIFNHRNFENLVFIEKRNENNNEQTTESFRNLKIKNIMLYGAPGVGKTYNYKRLISLIEEGNSESEIFNIIKEEDDYIVDESIYEDIKKDKRVEFVTFHQSYSYEDFIEGFRPNENGNIRLEDGVFKKLADEAQTNLLKSKSETTQAIFKEAIEEFLSNFIENEELLKVNLKRKDSYFYVYDYNEKTIYFEKKNQDRSHTLSLVTLEKMYYEETNSFIKGGLAPYYNAILDELLKIKRKKNTQKEEQKNFYVVIDEINRGNISKIFGELITLIEEDKRDNLEVTLPYSKEKFKIPSNLYIIATMNSTDKSIATIDIALRRRFTFLKMHPKPELIKDTNAKELMEKLNLFIKETRGEDFMLGHSYFMSGLDLEFIKKYKIKPLLEEYFYGDEENYKKALDILEKEV